MSDPLIINETLTIPASDLDWTAARASGAGGQNVNKVASKVELCFDIGRSLALPVPVRERLWKLVRNRIDTDGFLHIVSQMYRDQLRNLTDAREKLRMLILQALTPPKPRRPTRPTRASKERRLGAKRVQSRRKADRRGPGEGD